MGAVIQLPVQIEARDGQPMVSSREVADRFEKRHDNVLQAIRDLECSEEFRLLNFKESSYRNEQNREMPMYWMTRDGFSFLAMGFTGKEAARWRLGKVFKDPEKRRTYFREYMRAYRAGGGRVSLQDPVKPSSAVPARPLNTTAMQTKTDGAVKSINWDQPYTTESRFPYPGYLLQAGNWYRPDTGELVKPAPR